MIEVQTQEWYRKQFAQFGGDLKSLGWYNEKGAQKRYDAIVKAISGLVPWLRKSPEIGGVELVPGLLPTRKCSILDVGCGFGSIVCPLSQEFSESDWKYTGIDFMPEFIKLAQGSFTGGHAKFLVRSMSELSLFREPFDFVIANGTFNHRIESDDWGCTQLYSKVLRDMWDLANKAVIVTFASGLYDQTSKDTFAWNPASAFRLFQQFSSGIPRFSLRHDYLPNDFMIVARKDNDLPW